MRHPGTAGKLSGNGTLAAGSEGMSRARRRFYRTIILACLAMAALVWIAVDQFGITRQEITGLFSATLLVLVAVIVSAAGAALLWISLRNLWRRGRR